MAPIETIDAKAFIMMASWDGVRWARLFEEWQEYGPQRPWNCESRIGN